MNSKKNKRICFYPTAKIGDEIFRKLEELGFDLKGRYPTEHKFRPVNFLVIKEDNTFDAFITRDEPKKFTLETFNALEVKIYDIFEGRVKPYNQSKKNWNNRIDFTNDDGGFLNADVFFNCPECGKKMKIEILQNPLFNKTEEDKE